jgi:tRNA U55 pseudouridine synthase TruB
VSSKKLMLLIEKRINLVKGSFRQKDIIQRWHNVLDSIDVDFSVARFIISCSSGTYIRAISNKMGKSIIIPSLALNIKRTRIGEYTLI